MTMLCIMPEVESTLIWNNSAWNPPQYFVENNWVVCLLSCISQSGSPFTLTCILTTPKRNCLDQLLMNTISPCIWSSLKLCTFIANQKALLCCRHSNWKLLSVLWRSRGTQVGFSPSLPVVIVKCPVIPYHVRKFLGLMKYIIFSFASEIQGWPQLQLSTNQWRK